MADTKYISQRLDELMSRLDRLEERVYSATDRDRTEGQEVTSAGIQYCAMPPRPQRDFGLDVSADRAAAILALGGKWVNKTNLHYYLSDSGRFSGNSAQRDVVREAFDVWKDVGIGLTFTEVSVLSESELRIGFLHGAGSWSRIGTDALNAGQQEPTMNFGWNINVQGPNGLDTAIHEIGHALGFHHEHQNPNAGIVWDHEAVYDHFARTQSPPWDRDKTDHNILDKLDPHTVGGSDWDPDSIMHYSFEAGLIVQPERYRPGLTPQPGLSESDKEIVRFFYPDEGSGSVIPQLKPWESQLLSLGPGEQKDFNILPEQTRDYDFRTFGDSDTVMVLFEEDNGDFRYVKGDDDSGYNRNASFRVRLLRGHTYQLRIRLYFSFSSGDTAVMMW